MACVPGFQHDIFISYTHNDNALGWVDQFHDRLEKWLVRIRRLSNLKIWRDCKLHGNTEFDVAIPNKIKSSALFFALNSRNFLESAYCQKELAWFQEFNDSRPGGLRVGEQRRIFNIRLNNIHYALWPPGLGDAKGFTMYDAQSDDDLGDFLSPNDARYEKAFREIIDAAHQTLQEFASLAEIAAPANGAGRKIQVFVADVADMLQTQRDRLISDLRERGVAVLPDIPPPMENTPHEAQLLQTLTQARLSLHLLNEWAGRRIVDQKSATYPRRQLELALPSRIPQLIWVPDEVVAEKVADTVQRRLLEDLEHGGRENQSYEFVRGTFTAFAEIVLQKIAALQNQPAANGAAISLLLDHQQKDQRHAFKLGDLLEEKGLQVQFNQESFNPAVSLTLFEQALQQVRNLILLFGKASPEWVRGRLKKTVQIVGEQFETVHLENIWIVLLPGGHEAAMPQLPPVIGNMIRLLDNRHSEMFDPGVISPLLRLGGRP